MMACGPAYIGVIRGTCIYIYIYLLELYRDYICVEFKVLGFEGLGFREVSLNMEHSWDFGVGVSDSRFN